MTRTGFAYKGVSRAAVAVLAALVFLSASVSGAAAGEAAGAVLGNADILSLTRANVAPALIINQIYASPNRFDLSDQAFLELKANGVADEVLNAMLAASRAGAAVGAVGAAVPQLAALPRMPSVSLPPLGGAGSGSDWSDFGQDLAALPPPPALPSFSAPPPAPAASSLPAFSAAPEASSFSAGGGVPALAQLSSLPQMSSQVPAPATPAFAAPAPVAAVPSVSAAPPVPAVDPFSYTPVAPAVTAAPAAPAFSAPPVVPSGASLSNNPDALRRMLASSASQPDVQAGAVRALGAMNDQASLPALRDLLGSPSPAVRREAAKALALMNDVTAIGAAEQNLGNPVDPLDGLIHLVGYARLVRASDRLAAILSTNPSAANRAAAANALAEIGRGGGGAWPAIGNALANDADASVRREAARAVAQFHDPSSAALLMNACRRDPEVRRVALEAMAQYPEATGFLVGVVGLGPDQIAPDESETARASLAKLTGQDFGLDGAQWASWFAANGSGFASGGGSAPAGAPAAVPGGAAAAGAAGLSGILPPPIGGTASSVFGAAAGGAVSGGTPGQVDIAALGMIVDPSQIPMAPELETAVAVGGGASASADGVLRVPGAGLGLGIPPAALSANDFGGAGTGAGGIGAGSGAAGAGGLSGLPGGGGAGASGSGGVGTGRLPTPAGFEEYGDDQMWGGSMPAGGAGAMSADAGSGMGGFGGGDSSSLTSMSSLPRQPVVAPPSVPAAADTGASSSGLRLALPPMAGGGDAGYAAPTDDAAPPMDYADVGGATYEDSPWPQDTGAEDPYATDPYADPYAQGGATDTLAFPGDTDAFGLGEPMFEDDGAGAGAEAFDAGSYDAGAYDSGSYSYDDGFSGDAAFDDGSGSFEGGGAFDSPGEGSFDSGGSFDGTGLSMPPPPGGFVEDGGGDFGAFDDSMLVDDTDMSSGSGSDFAGTFPAETGVGEAAAPEPADMTAVFENYDYGDFDDGLHDGDADFAGDDFAAFLQGADLGDYSAAPEAPPAARSSGVGSADPGHEGTAEWANGDSLPPIGEPYTIINEGAAEAAAPSGRSGGTVMEWVRGRGLVEREVAAPVAAPEGPPAMEPLPEPVPVEDLETAPAASAASEPVVERAEVGAWHYVDPYEAPDAEGDAGSPEAESAAGAEVDISGIPIIAEDVYELPEPVEVISSDPSGRPSRRLRAQR